MSAPSELRVGIAGGGFMGEVHAHAARVAGARVAGVVASSPERSAAAAARLRAPRAYASFDEMVADVDVVHVCTPNALHAQQATAALAAGKHVVCEKPLATSVATAAEMVAAVGDRIASVPFVYRFHPLVREARARIRDGSAGVPVTIAGSYLQDWLLLADDDNWRVDPADGGPSRAFADIGSHLVDIVEFVTGDRIVRLAATTRTLHARRGGREVRSEDAAALTVVTAGGAIGTLLVSQVAPGRKNRLAIEIACSAESVAFDQEQPETLWIGRRAGSTLLPRDAAQLSPDAARLSRLPAGHPQGYQDAFDAFVADTYAAVDAAHTGGAGPDGLPTFADGLRAAVVTEAVLASAASGQWIEPGETS